MRIRTIQLKDFKGFDDLTIDLGDQPAKLIALVGPNGCGKSSVFDAFEELTKTLKGSNTGGEAVGFFNKNLWSTDPLKSVKGYER